MRQGPEDTGGTISRKSTGASRDGAGLRPGTEDKSPWGQFWASFLSGILEVPAETDTERKECHDGKTFIPIPQR